MAGREEAAAVGVVEEAEQLVGDGARVGEPRDVVELGEREERFEQRGVVLGVREVRARATSGGSGRRRGAARAAGSVALARAASIQSSRSSAAAASVSAARNSAFHPSSTLSSSPGRTRVSRRSSKLAELRAARLRRHRLVAVRDVQDVAAEAGVRIDEVPARGDAVVARSPRRRRRRRPRGSRRATSR